MSRLTLQGRHEVAEGTMAFQFARPDGFQFTAGQFLEVRHVEPLEDDPKGNLRNFSITSAPFETDLMIATRMRDSPFKQRLKGLPVGGEIEADGPLGRFTLAEDPARPLVLVAGGIGITPFRSMLHQAEHDGVLDGVVLFYSNRRPSEAAFLPELAELQTRNPGFNLIATMTAIPPADGSWQGETGHINVEMLSRYVEIALPAYYVAGPPAMVKAVRELLTGAGVERAKVRFEQFAGY